MKKILLFFSFTTLLFLSCFSQTSYLYDASGNMISRTVYIGASYAPQNSCAPSAANITDNIADLQFTVFPNPTADIVTISFAQEAEGDLQIFDMQGKTLYSFVGDLQQKEIDCSRYKSGAYFLKITVAGENIIWKIVKL